MRIIIAGGTGFIGQAIVKYFLAQQASITVLGRDVAKVKHLFAETVSAMDWQAFIKLVPSALTSYDLIINLTGANIGEKRWSTQRKLEILNSRIPYTQIIANSCAQAGEHSPALFNASAIGVYGLQATSNQDLPKGLTEDELINFQTAPDFLAEVARKWELATRSAYDAKARVVNMRFGVVLGPHGGVLQKLKLPYQLGLGGRIGSGKQPFSWIALNDLIRGIEFIFNRPHINGPINFVAPQCVSQWELAKTFAKVLHRPCFIYTPSFILKSMFGQMADELLLKGQHVVPKRLIELGFSFQYPDLVSALKTAIQS